MTAYVVTGKNRFKGFCPGETFVASLEPTLEERALTRGDIQIVERGSVSLDPARISMPPGWGHLTKGD